MKRFPWLVFLFRRDAVDFARLARRRALLDAMTRQAVEDGLYDVDVYSR